MSATITQEQVAQMAELAKDANRYRWLRMNTHPTVVIPCPDGIVKCPILHRRPAWGEALDTAIDKSIADGRGESA